MPRDGSRIHYPRRPFACLALLFSISVANANEPPPAEPAVALQGARAATPADAEHLAIYSAAKRGAKWLASAQRPDGLFVYGWNPALNRPLADDNILRQAGAAAALARAAANTHSEEFGLAARQVIAVLLAGYTEPDPDHPEVLRPTVNTADQHPMGFAALLLLAISELPAPGDTLVAQGEGLARYIVSRQAGDGSFDLRTGGLGEEGFVDESAIDYYPGEALYALMRSFSRGDGEWKLEAAKKALPFYLRHWKEDPSASFVPWQSGAFAEAFLLTRERSYAEFVFEMNDWLLHLQYTGSDSVRDEWIGGFASHQYGRVLRTTPGATTGSYLEALVDACRVAKLMEDQERAIAYRSAARSAIRFLMNNQYAMSEMGHYQSWFAKKLAGAFHGGVDDGIVRIDYTQHAINGIFHYLSHVVEYENPDRDQHRIPAGAPTAN